MEKLLINPYPIFIATIPFVLVIGYLSGDATLDVNVHDTYFVTARSIIAYSTALILGLYAFGYWLIGRFNRHLSKGLNILHVGLVYIGALILWLLSQLFRSDVMEYRFNDNLTFAIMIISVIMVLGQLVFPINIIYALTRKRNKL